MSIKPLRFRYRRLLLILIDVFCFAVVAGCYLAATYLVDRSLTYQTSEYLLNSLILIACILLFRLGGGIYFNVWRYTNTTSLLKLIVADAIGGVFAMLVSKLAGLYRGVWFFVTVAALNALLTLSSRFCYRLLYKFLNRNSENRDGGNRIPVVIVGAGQIGSLLANELQYGRAANYKPAFFIDSDFSKAGSRVAGLKVYPENDETLDVIREQGIGEIFIALAGLDNEKAIDQHPEYGHLRKMNYKEDFLFSSHMNAEMLERLFFSNTDNRLALEYLRAYYVLTNDRENYVKLMQNIKK